MESFIVYGVMLVAILMPFAWLAVEILNLHKAWRISTGILTIIIGFIAARCYFEVLKISDNLKTSNTVYFFIGSSLKCLEKKQYSLLETEYKKLHEKLDVKSIAKPTFPDKMLSTLKNLDKSLREAEEVENQENIPGNKKTN